MSAYKNYAVKWARYSHFIYWCAGVGAALVAPVVLRYMGIVGAINNELMALGFDAERVSLIKYLLLAFLSGALAGLLVQRRRAAWIGSLGYYMWRYLIPFIRQARHPGLGADGLPQILVPSALVSVLLVLVSLAFLLAGAGAVIGEACGQVLLVPAITLGKRLVAVMKKRTLKQEIPSVFTSLTLLALGGLLAGALLIGGSGIPSVLTFGPTTNLYTSLSPSGLVQHGTVVQGTFPSTLLGGARKYWIYLPPSYNAEQSRRYPTFYLLHGDPGQVSDCFLGFHVPSTADVLLAEGKIRETIFIAIDGNGPLYTVSEWANSFDGRQRMEDSLVQEFVPFIDSHYRTLARAEDRVIGGLSTGGYGAVNVALHHPDVFHEVFTMGGYFRAGNSPVFGPGKANDVLHRLNSPAQFLLTPAGKKAAKSLIFVIAIGKEDGEYYQDGLDLHRQMLALGVPVRLFVDDGGHSWPVWAKQFAETLPTLEPRE